MKYQILKLNDSLDTPVMHNKITKKASAVFNHNNLKKLGVDKN